MLPWTFGCTQSAEPAVHLLPAFAPRPRTCQPGDLHRDTMPDGAVCKTSTSFYSTTAQLHPATCSLHLVIGEECTPRLPPRASSDISDIEVAISGGEGLTYRGTSPREVPLYIDEAHSAASGWRVLGDRFSKAHSQTGGFKSGQRSTSDVPRARSDGEVGLASKSAVGLRPGLYGGSPPKGPPQSLGHRPTVGSRGSSVRAGEAGLASKRREMVKRLIPSLDLNFPRSERTADALA